MLRFFPPFAVLAGVIGYVFASQIAPLKSVIVPLLMLVMLCMGLTLRARDFVALRSLKRAFAIGVGLQFLVMPLLGFGIAHLFAMPAELQVGMILVGSVAGGTASNVMTFLARGNVALSVAMTTTSTLFSIVLTPLWLSLLSDQSIDIPASQIFSSLINIILLPIAAGLVLGRVLGARVKSTENYLALFAVIVILTIIAIVVSLNAGQFAVIDWSVIFAPLVHNVIGLTLGFTAARYMGLAGPEQRTIALEVGMQNSGLAAALAVKFFTPASALPAAFFSVWLNVTGALFARITTRSYTFERNNLERNSSE